MFLENKQSNDDNDSYGHGRAYKGQTSVSQFFDVYGTVNKDQCCSTFLFSRTIFVAKSSHQSLKPIMIELYNFPHICRTR